MNSSELKSLFYWLAIIGALCWKGVAVAIFTAGVLVLSWSLLHELIYETKVKENGKS